MKYRIIPVFTFALFLSLSFAAVAHATQIVITSGTSWTVPSDWNDVTNKIECIGAGGAGQQPTNSGSNPNFSGAGGGGGAYAITNTLSLTRGNGVSLSVAAGGSQAYTYFNGTSGTSASLSCDSGKNGATGSPGAGGAAASSIGNTTYNGGSGGTAIASGGGGGGAAGPSGAGQSGGNGVPTNGGGGGGGSDGGSSTAGGNASSSNPGAGGNGTSGTGGGTPSGGAGSSGGGGGGGKAEYSNAGLGGMDTAFSGSYGAGGGGGGGGGIISTVPSCTGGAGSAGYGGGGGGGGSGINPLGGSDVNCSAGNGTQGLIVVTYTPATAITGSCSGSPSSGTVGSTSFTWSSSISGGDGGAYTYSWSGTGLSGSGSSQSGTIGTAGSYHGYLTVTDISGDSSGSLDCGTVTVNKLTPTISISSSTSVNYNGSQQSVTVSGSVSGTVSNIRYNGSGTAPTNAGSYTITADFTPSDTTDYNSLSGATVTNGPFVINQIAPTLSVTNSPVNYNGSGQSATVSCTGGGSVSNILTGGSSSQTNAGTYAVTANCSSTTNYTAVTNASAGNFVINQITPTLSVTNSPVSYNGSQQSATLSCTGGGSISNIQYNGSATAPTNAGTYAVTANCSSTTNYTAVTSASAGNFVINKINPTLSVTNSPVSYNGSGQSATVSCTGGGSVSNILTGGSSSQTNAGTYAVTANCAASTNYSAVTNASAGNFVINTASQTITFNSLSNKVNGDAPFSVSATASSGLTVSFNSQTTGVCTSTGTNGTTITILTAGTCTIQATQSGNSNYAAATSVNRSFTVYAHLSVGACSASPLYSNPSITVTWSAAGLTGGMGPTPSYTYLWTLSGGANETTQGSLTAATVGASYSATSTYTGSLTITDANDSADVATCSPTGSVTIYPLITGGTCSVTPSSGPPSTAFTWNMPSIIGGDNGPYTYTWHGTNLTGNSSTSPSLALGINTYIAGTYTGNSVTVTDSHLDTSSFSCPDLTVGAAQPVGQVQFFGGKVVITGGHIYIR